MFILAISDIHGQTRYLPFLSEVVKQADLVVVSGDVTNFGGEQEASEVVSHIKEYNKRVIAVAGNCDYPGVDACLSREGMNLHARGILFETYAFIGVGGSLPCPGRTPNEHSEADFRMFLEEAKQEVPDSMPLILVSHQPPFHTNCDRAGMTSHVGSRSVRSFIEEVQPLICFSGHIHESRGIDRIGNSIVVNPGPLNSRGYVWVELEGRSLSLKLMQDEKMLMSI